MSSSTSDFWRFKSDFWRIKSVSLSILDIELISIWNCDTQIDHIIFHSFMTTSLTLIFCLQIEQQKSCTHDWKTRLFNFIWQFDNRCLSLLWYFHSCGLQHVTWPLHKCFTAANFPVSSRANSAVYMLFMMSTDE